MPGEWEKMELNNFKFDEKPKKIKGRIMFPTQHDILPEFIDYTIRYLGKWLKEGNEILITSKPHFECIEKICEELDEYKDQIVFRFTIGSMHDDYLKFWEPNAPGFEERYKCLKHAYANGFQTSVSCEPYFEEDIDQLVTKLLPFITDTIWIGKMNFIQQRVDTSKWTNEEKQKYLGMIKKSQTNDFIWELYHKFKNNQKVKWKESCKKVLGLPEEEIG